MKSILATSLALLPSIATEHAMLESALPPVGGTVHVAPAELTLAFSEAIEPRFSTVSVFWGRSDVSLGNGPIHTDAGDSKRLLVPVQKLQPGTYIVNWHAVSVDTHRTQGTYRFTIAP